MATVEDCRAALTGLAAKLATVDPDTRSRHSHDRTLSLTVTDLGTTFAGRIVDGQLVDVVAGDGTRAQIRLACSSDDLVALAAGGLNAAGAWAAGRLRIEASPLDLLRLRSLF